MYLYISVFFFKLILQSS